MRYLTAHRNLTFLLFICVCVFTDRTYYPLSVISAVLLHEAGHLLAAKILNIPLFGTDFTPFGIRLKFDLSTERISKEVWVYLSGPIVSIIAGTVVLIWASPYNKAVFTFALFSLTFGLVNLMPIKRLDGGCIAESILSTLTSPVMNFNITKAVSDVFVFLFWFCAVYVSLTDEINVSMIALAVYLIFSSL